MNKTTQRVGGAARVGKVDPQTSKWLQGGAQNPKTETGKEKAERQRQRARYDIDPRLKAAIEKAARSADIDTSYTQFAEILLTVAMAQFLEGKLDKYFQKRSFSRSLRFRYDYKVPTEETEKVYHYGAL